jgi:hypothetical protein
MARYATNDEAFESGFREAMKDWSSMSIEDMKRIGSTQSQKLQSDDAHSWNLGYRAAIDHIDGWVSRGVHHAEELGLVKEFKGYHGQKAFFKSGGKRRRGYSAMVGPMTDTDVLREIDKLRRAERAAMTKAKRQRVKATREAFSRFGSSDVEQAARSNAVQRAETREAKHYNQALARYLERRESLRARAGQWAELVPGLPADAEITMNQIRELLK